MTIGILQTYHNSVGAEYLNQAESEDNAATRTNSGHLSIVRDSMLSVILVERMYSHLGAGNLYTLCPALYRSDETVIENKRIDYRHF